MYLLIDAPAAGRYADAIGHVMGAQWRGVGIVSAVLFAVGLLPAGAMLDPAPLFLSVAALPLLAGVSLAKLGMGRSR